MKLNIVDVVGGRIFCSDVLFSGKVLGFLGNEDIDLSLPFALPIFVDSHVHVESSMLVPSVFAQVAVRHGVGAVVADPHEIANVLGVRGVEYMINDAECANVKFYFGVPSCVPATFLESAGAVLDSVIVSEMLDSGKFKFLSEMMNFPGVVYDDAEVTAKLTAAHRLGLPVDGHAPGLKGEMLAKYAAAGITTDHESSTSEEAEEKIKLGVKLLIREGSAAKNFNNLIPLLDKYPESVMFCSDDKHPDDLLESYLNGIVRRAVAAGCDLFNVLRAVSLNPKLHYKLDNGLLQIGDAADFVVVDNLTEFNVLETYIDGKRVYAKGQKIAFEKNVKLVNNFNIESVNLSELRVIPESNKLNVMNVIDGELLTTASVEPALIENDNVVSDISNDVLKIVVLNRYVTAKPAIGFVKGFGLKQGAMATSVAHDSHNLIAIGVSDELIVKALNAVIASKGGMTVVTKDSAELLELPVAGLMSDKPAEVVAKQYSKLNFAAKALGSQLTAPFMTLSFMSLIVIPEIKLSDKGLFDGKKFEFMSVFAK